MTMKIKGKIKEDEFLKIKDLQQYGDVFVFIGDNTPYMIGSTPYSYHAIINLDNGECTEVDDEMEKRPIRILKATLVIED